MRRLLVALCVVLAACSDGGSDGAVTTTVGPETTTTSLAGTTTTPTTAGPACGEPAVSPVTVAAMAQAAGDVDGDGTTDRLMTYGAGSAEDPAPWHVRVELGSGGGFDGEIPDAPGFAPVRMLGAADVDGDDAAEVFAVVNSGASVALVGVFQWGGCTLARLAGPVGAEPTLFAVGGTVTHLDGLACIGPALTVRSATSDDGTTYATRTERLEVVEGAFVPAADSATESTLEGDDPSLGDYATIDCPGVESP